MFKSKSLEFASKLPDFAFGLNFVKTKENCALPNSSNLGSPELEETNIFDAQMITSKHQDSDIHYPILDFDFPVEVIKSSSGNSHVYVGKAMQKESLDKLVNTLTEVGLLQDGVRRSWVRNGFLSLRLPWVKKGEDKSYAQQQDPSLEQPKQFVSQTQAPVENSGLPPTINATFIFDEGKGIYFNKEYGLMFDMNKVNPSW